MFEDYPRARASGGQHEANNLHNGGLWNSGGFPPQWIEIDLGRAMEIKGIKITCEQYPVSAKTYHMIKAGESPNPSKIITVSNQVTHTNEELSFSLATRARYIRIETTESPSWIAWKNLRIYQDD